ncbi:MAG: polysaccharide biosynthesis tyrosine autokinase [Verrucomicrobiota bacterium]
MEEQSRNFQDVASKVDATGDWRVYYQAVLDRIWIVVLFAVLGTAIAGFVLSKQETKYASRAVIFLEQDKQRVLGGTVQDVVDTQVRSLDMLNTVVATLKTYPFALRVAEHLKLGKNQLFLRAMSIEKTEIPDSQAAGMVAGSISVSYRKATRLIDIVAVTRSGEISVLLADGYANEYLRLVMEQRTNATRSAGQYLVEEASRLGAKMRVSEEALQSFRERERAASLDTMLTESQGQVNKLNGEIAATQEQFKQLDADLVIISGKNLDADQLLKLSSVANQPAISSISAAIKTQEAGLDALSQRYLPAHPIYAAAEKQLQILIESRKETLSTVISQLKGIREQLQNRLTVLSASLAEAEKELLKVTGKSVEYNALTRELQTDKTLYESVLNRLKEVDLTKGLAEGSASVHEPALGASTIPVPYVKTLLMGLFGGIALGIVLAIGIGTLDPSVRTVEQAEMITGLGVITVIPRIKTKNPGLMAATDRHGVVAEAFRTARTALVLTGDRVNKSVLLFTSALPGEGKTFCSANFAVALAHQGLRTLYMDADLRNPSVSKLFYGEHRKPGFSDVLLGASTLRTATLESGIENLSILTAGSRPPNPAELLSHASLEQFFIEARAAYDCIILDTAPVIAVSDTLLLVRFVDVCALVVRAQATARKSIKHAIRLLDDLDRPPAGIFLNMLNEGHSYYAYSGRVYGRYGAKGVYGAPEKHKEA